MNAIHRRSLHGTARRVGAGLVARAAFIAAIVACASGTRITHAGSSRGTDISAFQAKERAALQATPRQYGGPATGFKAPKKLKIALISCYSILHGCESPVIGATHAAQALGWQVLAYDGGGNPSKQNADMLDAISAGANVIVNVAIDPNLVQQGLREAKARGVLVVSGSSGLSSPNPTAKPAPGKLGYAFDVAPNYAAAGAEAADWIIVDSKGTANVLVFSDKEFPSVIAFQVGLLAELQKCTGCKISPLQYFTGAQVGPQLQQQTTGYLQSHPDVNYVFSPYDPAAAAQVTAIQQAGLGDKVKLVSVLGDQQNIQFIRTGTVQAADAAYDNEYMGYAIVDQIIRLLNKQPVYQPIGEDLPYGLLVKSNLPAAGSDWLAPYDYKSKFLKRWK